VEDGESSVKVAGDAVRPVCEETGVGPEGHALVELLYRLTL
jgi:hypothetical protein